MILIFDDKKQQFTEKRGQDSIEDHKPNVIPFGADQDDNILDRSKRGLEKLSWFQRLFK